MSAMVIGATGEATVSLELPNRKGGNTLRPEPGYGETYL